MTETARPQASPSRILGRIRAGQLTVIEDDRETVLRHRRAPGHVHIHDPKAWPHFLRGSRGLGTAYMDGLWDTPDLTAVIRVAARNVDRIDDSAAA